MSNNIPSLNIDDRNHLFNLHKVSKNKDCLASCSTAAAAFLILGALIVISCASLCFTLPGINAIQDVILPGILPGIGAILLSLPFIIYSIRQQPSRKTARQDAQDFTLALFSWHQVDQMDKETKISFIHNNFFKSKWSNHYCKEFMLDLKKRYPKQNQSDEEKALLEAFDETIKEFYK